MRYDKRLSKVKNEAAERLDFGSSFGAPQLWPIPTDECPQDQRW